MPVTLLNPVQAFNNYCAIARQDTRGAAETAPTIRLRTMPIAFNPVAARAFPFGEVVGNRDINNNLPVPGRRFAQGAINTFVRSDTWGNLLWHALGGASTPVLDPAGVRYRHEFTCVDATVPQPMTLWDYRGSTVGATPSAYRYADVDVDSMSLRFDAADDTGLIAADYNFLGFYPSLVTETALATPLASQVQPISSWRVEAWITNPTGGSEGVESRIMRFDMTFNQGLTRVKSAVADYNDQGHNFSGRTLVGTIQRVLPNTNSEVFADLSVGSQTFGLRFKALGFNDITSGAAVTEPDGFEVDMPRCMVNGFPIRSEMDGYMIETVNFTAYRHEAYTGPLKVKLWNDIATGYSVY